MTKKVKIIFAIALSFLFIISASLFIGQRNNAKADELTPILTNYAKNLSFDDNVHVLYAIKTENLKAGDKLTMLLWTSAPDEYVYGTQNAVLEPNYQDVNGEVMPVFTYGLAAKQMTDTLYTVACVQRGENFYYSAPRKYSVIEYAYNKLGKTEATPTSDDKLVSLLNGMLVYGGAAQVYFNYQTDRLASQPHAYVKINHATFADGYDYAIAKVGSKLEIFIEDGYSLVDDYPEYISVEGEKVFVTVPENKTIDTDSIAPPHEHEFKLQKLDNQKHWLACICGAVSGEEEHFGGTATCTQLATCVVCGFGYGHLKEHEYTKFLFDNDNHWYECDCGNKSGLAQHSGGVATCTKLAQCLECGEEYGSKLPHNFVDGIECSCGEINTEYYTEGLTFKRESEYSNYTVSSYDGTDSEVVIPLTHNQIPVTKIADSAFKDCSVVERIIISENILSIGNYAFKNCSSLIEIELPNNVSSVGCQAFYDCKSLKSVKIGTGLSVVGDQLFANCVALDSLTIGYGIKSIGSYAFQNCLKLVQVTLPESVTSINSNAFNNCSSLTKVVIPNSVRNFGANVFYGCKALEYTVENGLNYLGNEHNDYLYLAGAVSKTITTAMVNENCKFIGSCAFQACKTLTNVQLPITITDVGEDAFYNCSALESIVIPNRVRKIGQYAFYNCSSLSSVVLSSRLENVGVDAFRGCSALTKVYYDGTIDKWAESASIRGIFIGSGYKEYNLYINGELVTDVEITTATKILSKAFLGCASIESVTIGKSVNQIGSNAFSDCELLVIYCETNEKPTGWADSWNNNCFAEIVWDYKNSQTSQDVYLYANIDGIRYALKDGKATLVAQQQNIIVANIPQTVTYDFSSYTVTTIADSAFADCSLLKEIHLPNSVLAIGDNAFAGCSSLSTVRMSEGLVSIGSNAFYTCTSLTSIEIPNSVTYMGDYAFYYCSALKSVVIGNGVCSIGTQTFYYCTSLESISIGSAVESIGYGAFQGCYKLYNVDISDSVITISDNAFYNCSSLKSIVIGNGVTNIGANAFYGCDELTSVTIAKSVAKIGEDAFRKCNSLVEMNFLGTINDWVEIEFGSYYSNPTAMTNDLFINGQLVERAVITSATKISSMVFVGCISLESVTIGNSVTYVASDSLSTCRALIVYCEASSKPSGWNSCWNCYDVPVVWDYNNNQVAEDGNIYATIDGIRYALNSDMAIVATQKQNITTANIPTIVKNNGVDYSVVGISDYAFALCDNLVSVSIPEGITRIGSYAFAYCNSLESVTIPNSVEELGAGAFTDCIVLEQLVIGTGISEISQFTFANCYSLTNVIIPKGVMCIGDNAFDNCCLLNSIEIPNSITSIGVRAFANCSNLMNIIIPNYVNSVGDYAFENCIKLQTATIYKDVAGVGNSIFDNCYELQKINCVAESRPRDWKVKWLGRTSAQVVWGVKLSDIPVLDNWITNAPGIGSYSYVDYVVQYYFENANNEFYTLDNSLTEYNSGLNDRVVNISPKVFEHYTLNSSLSIVSGVNNGSLVLKVYYDRNTYTVSSDMHGTVTNAGDYKYGTQVTLIAVPNSKCVFEGWYIEGELVSTEEEYTLIVTSNVVAKFAINEQSFPTSGEWFVDIPGI